MNDFTTQRFRYTQIFIACLLAGLLYVLSQSIYGGLAGFETNLPYRQFLINNFIRLRLKIGDRVLPTVVVGKDKWLELAGISLDVYQNVPILPPDGHESMQKNLKILYDKLRERNITLYVVIVPNKSTIYPDRMPNEIQKISAQSELDMLVDLLQKEGPPVLIDLRPAFHEARQKKQIYFSTDTHWNAFGALIAYRTIMNELSQTYPKLAPRKISDFRVRNTKPRLRDLSLYAGSNIFETSYIITPRHKNDFNWVIYNGDFFPMRVATSSQDKLPKLLMYYDSFGETYLNDLIAPHFSQSTFISNTSTSPDIVSFKQVEASKPDIVILEFVERYHLVLYNFLNNYGLESVK